MGILKGDVYKRQLPVEVATGIGRQSSGLKGMAAAATAMALPGALLTVLLQAVISSAGSMVKSQINYLSVGISAFIILTLLAYSLGTVRQACLLYTSRCV